MTSPRRRRLLLLSFAVVVLALATATQASASSTGPAMPWDSAISALADNLTGTVAKGVVLIATAIAGIVWALTDHGTGLKRISQVALAGGVCAFAAQFITALGFSGVCF